MLDYLHDPNAISRASLTVIRKETDVSALPEELHNLVLRIVHACGMPDVVSDLAWSDGAATAGREALCDGAAVFTDTEMVSQGILRKCLPNRNEVICTLNDPRAAATATSDGITRAAAAVELWSEKLAGAVVAIGAAPTALFRLLELMLEGGHKPALVLGFPVGFIGAAESKETLICQAPKDVAYIALRGRRGGSAMAAAAVNALCTTLGGEAS